MNWMLALRRFRLSLMKQLEPRESCMICGCAAEPYEYVCDGEECQLRALDGQAMLANNPAEPAPPRRRVRFANAAQKHEMSEIGYHTCF